MVKSFYIFTMGCQMNEYDSDYLAQSFMNAGALPAEGPDDAELVIVNTCSVREKPEQKAMSQLGRIIRIKNKHPDMIIGAVGCVAQDRGPELLQRFPGLDFVMGPRELKRAVEVVEDIEKSSARTVATDLAGLCRPPLVHPGYFSGRVSGYVSIMEGCNNFCSYCIVPFVRGREVSRPAADIEFEIHSLASQGVREVTLLGQNVNSYRFMEEEKPVTLSSLLKRIGKINEIWRIRFTTSHPRDLTDDLVECFKTVHKLCPHIHLPFQTGSNRILKLMGRGYTREYYLERVEALRTARPDIAITADVMVGFPGESEEDYKMTMDIVEEVEFDGLYSFMYSDRRGTAAEKLAGKLDRETKAARLKTLQTIQKEISHRKNKALEGTVQQVLVEGAGDRPDQQRGRTATNKVVNFRCKDNRIGELVDITITHGLMNSLRGCLNE